MREHLGDCRRGTRCRRLGDGACARRASARPNDQSDFELGADAITVNAVAPGLTLVEATQYVPARRHRLHKEQRALQRDQVPGDVCGSVVFALSSLSRFVTGQLLAVNGGFVMH